MQTSGPMIAQPLREIEMCRVWCYYLREMSNVSPGGGRVPAAAAPPLSSFRVGSDVHRTEDVKRRPLAL